MDILGMYLHKTSTMGMIWHKVNFKTGNDWFEVRIFFFLLF